MELDPSIMLIGVIKLNGCTLRYRFAELHYHRAKTTYKGRDVPARVETVVMYTPDTWSIMPSALEWDGLQVRYQRALDKIISDNGGEVDPNAMAVDCDDKA